MIRNQIVPALLIIALFSSSVRAQDDDLAEFLSKRPVIVAIAVAAAAAVFWVFSRSPTSTLMPESPAELCEHLRSENEELKRINEAINAQVLDLQQRHAESEAAAHSRIDKLEAEIEQLNEMLERGQRVRIRLEGRIGELQLAQYNQDCIIEEQRNLEARLKAQLESLSEQARVLIAQRDARDQELQLADAARATAGTSSF